MRLLIAIVVASFSLMSLSCKKSESSSNIEQLVVQGKWKITMYTSSDGTNNTSNFTGYEFEFMNNGTVTAKKGTNTVNGSWAKGTDDSTPKFILLFTTSPFTSLSEDWRIQESNTSKIRLQHVSGSGTGGTELLTFEKI